MSEQEQISRIIEVHSKLARRAKEYEQVISLFPPTEVLNEMRYALRGLIELWVLDHQEDVDQQAFAHAEQKTYHALICAYHDLVDGLVMDITASMTRMTEEFPEAAYEILGSLRVEIIDAVNEVDEKIAASREDTTLRPGIYEEFLYDQWYDKLLNYKKTLRRTVHPEIVKRQQEIDDLGRLREEKKRQEDHRFWVTWWVAIVVSIAGVILGAVALL